MGKIGFGYGSEYQLMRFMGRHLQEFNHHVKEAIGSNDDIFWFDFYKQSRRDHELMNMDFISCEKTKKEWDQLWPTNGGRSGINWDLVGKIGDIYLLVEAKAHAKEIFQGMGAKHQDSISMIKEAFSNLAKTYHLTINDSWYKDYYQMMNRLVAVDFLNRKGYQAFLINVYFIHGYEINAHGNPLKHNLSVPTREAWLQIIEKQYQELGLNDSFIKQYIKTVFIEC